MSERHLAPVWWESREISMLTRSHFVTAPGNYLTSGSGQLVAYANLGNYANLWK